MTIILLLNIVQQCYNLNQVLIVSSIKEDSFSLICIYLINYIFIISLMILDNVKALFRRGKAHIGAWNPEQAKEDLTKVLKLDPSLKGAVSKELQLLSKQIQLKNKEDKNKLQKLFNNDKE